MVMKQARMDNKTPLVNYAQVKDEINSLVPDFSNSGHKQVTNASLDDILANLSNAEH